jgi:hypothetical protein
MTIIRDSLRTNLTDPYSLAGGQSRGGNYFIFTDEPLTSAKYPQVQLKQIDNPRRVISIGSNYGEQERLVIQILFFTKNGFKITVSGTEYVNSQLVSYYESLIETTLKDKFADNTLYNLGIKGYKCYNATTPEYEESTQLYFGAVLIEVFYFKDC